MLFYAAYLTDAERYEAFVGPVLSVVEEPLRSELERVSPVLGVVVDGVQVHQETGVLRHVVPWPEGGAAGWLGEMRLHGDDCMTLRFEIALW